MIRLVVLAFVLASAKSFAAQCPTYNDLSLLRVEPALTALAPKMVACADNPITAGLYGGLLLRNGQVDQALIWLEKSLLINAEQPGVQADFALALSAAGQSQASSDLASQVIERSDVPMSAFNILGKLISGERWEQRLQISSGIGVASNIEFVPELEAINLTFGDDGIATIPLVKASEPTTRAIFQQSLSWAGSWQGRDIRLNPGLSVTERSAAGSTDADSQLASGEIWIEHGRSNVALGVGVTGANFEGNFDRDEWFLATRVRVGELLGSCQWLVGGRYNEATYALSIYDARVSSLNTDIFCPQGWRVGIELSKNEPVNRRVGGSRALASLAVARQAGLGPGQLQTAIVFVSEADADGYSEFLARGEPREIKTVRAGVTWEVSLGGGWTITPSMTFVRQSSNIELFNVNGSEFLMNMIYTF